MSLLYISQEKAVNEDLERYALANGYQYCYKEFKDLTVQYANDKVLGEYEPIVTNEDETIYGFMLGEIYDIEEERAALKAKHCFIHNNDIEYLIHLYEEYGLKALENLNGRFVVLLVNTITNEYILLNDRYGSYKYYYAFNGEKYAFCNNPAYLLDFLPKRELNREAVGEFFTFGFMLGTKTLLQGINLLGGASICNLKPGSLNSIKYWDWSYLKKGYTKSFEEAVSEFGELWLKTIKKILDKHQKFNLMLSGGLDSRAILAAVDYLGLNDKINSAYTFGQKGCWDIIIAKQLAKIAGINHVVAELNADTWRANIDSAIGNTFGAKNTIDANGTVLKKMNPSWPVLSGIMGDVVCGGSYLREELINSTTQEIPGTLYNLLRKQKGIRNSKLLKNYKGSKVDLGTAYSAKDLYLVVTYGMNYIDVKVLGDQFYYIKPFMDNELVDFMYGLPDEWRIKGRLYKEMLVKYFPKYYSEIPWQRTCAPISTIINKTIFTDTIKKGEKNREQAVLFGASKFGKDAIELLKHEYGQIYFCDNDKEKWHRIIKGVDVIPPYVLKKLSRINEIKVIITSMYWREISTQLINMGITNFEVFQEVKDYRSCDKWLRTPGVYEQILEILLSPKCKKRNYFNYLQVKKTLIEHMKGKINAAQDIGLMVTFELFCRRFLDLSD